MRHVLNGSAFRVAAVIRSEEIFSRNSVAAVFVQLMQENAARACPAGPANINDNFLGSAEFIVKIMHPQWHFSHLGDMYTEGRQSLMECSIILPGTDSRKSSPE
jgi:hypothetical protein